MIADRPTVWDHVLLNRRDICARALLEGVYRTSGMVNRQPVFSIEFSFSDRQGRPFRDSLWSYDRFFIAQLAPGSQVAIGYDPDKPCRCRFAANGIGLMNIATVLCCATGLSLFLTGFFSARGRVRLLRGGTAVMARVSRIIATSQSAKKGPIVKVRYMFITGTGKPVAGTWTTTTPPQVGAEILIVYNARRPGENMPA